MISIEVAPKDLLQVRFGFSPLIEISLSYMVYRSYRDGVHDPVSYVQSFPLHIRRWAEETHDLLWDFEFPYMDALIMSCKFVADFLTPTPTATHLSFEDELKCLLNTPRELIWKDIEALIHMDGDSDERQQFLHDPEGALYCLVEELRLYWKLIFSSHWSRSFRFLKVMCCSGRNKWHWKG